MEVFVIEESRTACPGGTLTPPAGTTSAEPTTTSAILTTTSSVVAGSSSVPPGTTAIQSNTNVPSSSSTSTSMTTNTPTATIPDDVSPITSSGDSTTTTTTTIPSDSETEKQSSEDSPATGDGSLMENAADISDESGGPGGDDDSPISLISEESDSVLIYALAGALGFVCCLFLICAFLFFRKSSKSSKAEATEDYSMRDLAPAVEGESYQALPTLPRESGVQDPRESYGSLQLSTTYDPPPHTTTDTTYGAPPVHQTPGYGAPPSNARARRQSDGGGTYESFAKQLPEGGDQYQNMEMEGKADGDDHYTSIPRH